MTKKMTKKQMLKHADEIAARKRMFGPGLKSWADAVEARLRRQAGNARIVAAQRENERAVLEMVKRHTAVRGAYHPVSLNTASANALDRLLAKGLVLVRAAGGYVPRTPRRRVN